MEKILVVSEEKLKTIVSNNRKKKILNIFQLYRIYNLFKNKKNPNEIDMIIDYNNVPSSMKFPINHPIDGCLYLSSVVDETTFYPLSEYHEKLKQEKLADFTKLCASLGAKSCKAISDQSSDKSMHGDIGGIVDKDNKGSVSADYHNNHKSLTQYSAEFPESNNRITDYNSLWINGEPSWKTMKDLRIQKGILKYEAKFSYTDDFGINAKFDAKVQKMGINVGFKFESIKKETVIINVEFNPIS